jgi:hypothetical protein
MKLDEFDERAAEYALSQRTDLAPQRRSGMACRIADRLRLMQSWDSFVCVAHLRFGRSADVVVDPRL